MRVFLGFLTILLLTQLAVSAPFFSKQHLKKTASSIFEYILQTKNLLANESCTKSCCASLPSRPAMTYRYYQNTGKFVGGTGEYAINTRCYSGQG